MSDLENPDLVKICYQEESSNFKILVTAAGITMTGESPVFGQQSDLQELAKAIGGAATDHIRLKKGIYNKLVQQ